MKVLQINNVHYRRGGADVVYLNTAELLQQHGNEVVFFNMKRKSNLPCDFEKYWVNSLETCGKNPLSFLKQLRNLFYNPDAAKNIEELIIAEKPDIAHIHLFYGMGISPSICEVLHKYQIPLVHTVHDYRMVCPISLLMDKKKRICEKCEGHHYYKAMLEGCSHNGRIATLIKAAEMYYHDRYYPPLKVIDGFIFVSNFAYQKHCQYMPRMKNAQTIVLHNFVKRDDALGIKRQHSDYFLYYGRLSYEKGISTLLKVFTRHPELKLNVVGTGPIENELKKQYCESGTASTDGVNNDNINFLGYHYGDSLAELVRNARFVCVPSEWYENNPMTIVESYSMGTPVIGARIGGIPEIVDDEETGYLFTSGDVEELEKTILRASSLEGIEYEQLCLNSYEFYQQNFSPEQHYEKLMAFYQTVLNFYHSN